jgi:excisionase family DNA binding protein
MNSDVLSKLERRVLVDLVRGRAVKPRVNDRRFVTNDQTTQVAPVGESLCAYLRTLRRWIVTKEVASLLHCHAETIYKRVKIDGLPAHRDGRTLKYYPPEIADWLEQRDGK